MPILIATFPETKEVAKKVARALKAEYTEIFTEDFPDSEFHVKLKKNPKNKTVVIMNSITHDPDEKLIETLLAGGVARDYKAKKVILVATYFPYLRQDKHFEKWDSFSSKYILKLFTNFDKIITIDPHLHRIKHMEDWATKAHSVSTVKLVANYIKKRFGKNFTIVGPDEESSQWSGKVAKILGDKVVILKKTRFSSTHIKVREKNNEKISKNVIIIDDIISTGKTIMGAIKLAKSKGARKVIVIGVHGILSGDADKKILKEAELVTSNSIPNKYAKIDVSPIIAEALKK